MEQNIYLSNMEFNIAVKHYFDCLGEMTKGTEIIDTRDSLDRITISAVYSRISSPFYNSSAMDGIATLSHRTFNANDKNHVELIEGRDYIVVDTGDPIPGEFDCVIMVEDLIRSGEGRVKIYKSAVPWQNIRPLGEDIVENQMIIPSNHIIRPVDIGALLAGGVNSVEVYKRPVVGIIPTGTELVAPGEELKLGNIIDFNSSIFKAQIQEYGGIPRNYGIIKDNYNKIKETVKGAAEECDIVLIGAGSSAGREDFTSSIIGELGEVFVHGIAIKPGKPVILGRINSKPVIGIPGYPVSAYFIMELIVKDVIKKMLNMELKEYKTVSAITSRRIMSSLKYMEFVRVKLGYVGEKLMATPLNRGAGSMMSLVRADGVLNIPQNVEGIEAGETVHIRLLRDEDEVKNTVVCIGSHDPIIDILGDILHKTESKYFLSSSHVGSMGGIMALKNNETHIAPIHLLDMDTGEYNISYINKYLPGRKMVLVKCVKRIQGMMVKRGNPLNIKDLVDIVDKKLKFVNRQRGSGTRILLDYYLKKNGINPSNISGYEREEFTHLSVAAAVAAGDADAGLGIYSAAGMMGLDFIPLSNEEYDIAIPAEYMNNEMIQNLLDVMESSEFIREVKRLGGYDTDEVGKIIRIGD